MKSSSLGRKPKNIRSRNTQLIIDLYREHETLSITRISRLIKLSRTTVMIINDHLLTRDIIEEAGKGDSSGEGGKRPFLYRLKATRGYIITFHIKYDTVDFRLSDLSYGCLAEDSEPISRNMAFPLIAERMGAILGRNGDSLSPEDRLLACLVAVHGNVDSESGICLHSTHFPSWGTRTDLAAMVRRILPGDCPVHIDTWTRFKVYGENRLGCARGQETVVLVEAGWHGINAGILLKGEVYGGKHFLSGEIGHIRVNREDRELCDCGSRGCLEQQILPVRLNRRIGELREDFPSSPLAAAGAEISIGEALLAAERGDALAREVLGEIGDWIALALSQIIMFFDPETILISGDYALPCSWFQGELKKRVGEISLPRLERGNGEIIFADARSVPTLKGAAVYGVDRYFNTD